MDSGRRQNLGDRRSEFKFQGLTPEELRRRREETSVEIRKSKREDSLNKRRNLPPVGGASLPSTIDNDFIDEEISMLSKDNNEFGKMIQEVKSADSNAILDAATKFRKLLSKERNPPIADVINAKIVPRFVELLSNSEKFATSELELAICRKIQFEAAWVLTNIASGTTAQTRAVIECGAVPAFADKLANNRDVELAEQCIWALGNIAGDSPICRDLVLASDVMIPLLKIIHSEIMSQTPKMSLVRNATWTLSNLCRGKPTPPWSQVAPALGMLIMLIQANDPEILADTCWSYSFLSDGAAININGILKSGAHHHLIRHLGNTIPTIVTPALRAIGNIVTGDDQQTQAIIDAGALPQIRNLINHTKISIRKEACWVISNITAGTMDQVKAVFDAQIVPLLIEALKTADFKVRKEACWAICNATSVYKSHPEMIRYIVNQDAIKPLCDILSCSDVKITLVALDGLENILKCGADEALADEYGVNPYTVLIEECGGLDRICDIQKIDTTIYDRCKQIVDLYFGGAEEMDDLQDSSVFTLTGSQNSIPHEEFKF